MPLPHVCTLSFLTISVETDELKVENESSYGIFTTIKC